MNYYLDTEFNGHRGALISLALVSDVGRELYLAVNQRPALDPWVEENVIPRVDLETAQPSYCDAGMFGARIAQFLIGDETPCFVADWPDDIRYLCECLITGPGTMVDIPRAAYVVERVDAYPAEGCALAGAVQHNALWDARALRHLIQSRDAFNRA